MRSRPGWVETEVWFRVVRLTQAGQSVATVAAYREQTVEIALGPKGVFENGNVDSLKRRAPPDQIACAVLPSRSDPKPARVPKTPRVVELLRKAIEWKDLLESGEVASQAEIALRERITRARVTRIMGMLRLAPETREQILAMHDSSRRPPITERVLRPISVITPYRDQLQEFHKFLI